MSTEPDVRRHFDADAERFDAIYRDDKKGPVSRWVDNVWRGVVRRRVAIALEKLEPVAGKRILDVGCGSGVYCLTLAQRGAEAVLGIDFAPAMIELARESAERTGLADRCEFVVGTFPEAVPNGPFDATMALGYFDYIRDPVRHISHMRTLTPGGTLVMSFPKSREWRVPIRRLRFKMLKVPLFLYTKERVKQILDEAGIASAEWIELDRDYLIVART